MQRRLKRRRETLKKMIEDMAPEPGAEIRPETAALLSEACDDLVELDSAVSSQTSLNGFSSACARQAGPAPRTECCWALAPRPFSSPSAAAPSSRRSSACVTRRLLNRCG
jgi:hypothetical protein